MDREATVQICSAVPALPFAETTVKRWGCPPRRRGRRSHPEDFCSEAGQRFPEFPWFSPLFSGEFFSLYHVFFPEKTVYLLKGKKPGENRVFLKTDVVFLYRCGDTAGVTAGIASAVAVAAAAEAAAGRTRSETAAGESAA